MEIDEHDTPGLFFSRELIGKHLPVRHWWMVFKATGQGDLTWGTCLDVHEGRSEKEGSRRGGKRIEAAQMPEPPDSGLGDSRISNTKNTA